MTNTEAPARTVRVHSATVVPARGYGDDHWHTEDMNDSVTKIRLKARHQGNRECTWIVGFVGPDGVARNVDGPGRDRVGPYAYLVPECTVISARVMPGQRAAQDHLVEGDYVAVRGFLFRVDDSRGRFGYNPTLELVTQ